MLEEQGIGEDRGDRRRRHQDGDELARVLHDRSPEPAPLDRRRLGTLCGLTHFS